MPDAPGDEMQFPPFDPERVDAAFAEYARDDATKCKECGGSGLTKVMRYTSACPACKGSGRIPLGLGATLKEHWLWRLECDHDAKTDRAHCSCGRWSSEPLPSVGKAVEAWAVHVSLIAAPSTPATDTPAETRDDTARLDWLDKQKVNHGAHWGGGEGFGCPSSWNNPSVSWSVGRTQKCGTYNMPRELVEMSVREAIDDAMDAALSVPVQGEP